MDSLLNKNQAVNFVKEATSLEVVTVYDPSGETLCTKWFDFEDLQIQKVAATAFIDVVKDHLMFTVE